MYNVLPKWLKGAIYSLFLLIPEVYQAQNIDYAREVLDTLCSETMFGRGYLKNGHLLAADYLENEFKRLGLEPVAGTYQQKFNLNVNTFPNNPEFIWGSKEMTVGQDYLILPNSGSINRSLETLVVPKKAFKNIKSLQKFLKKNVSNKAFIVDLRALNQEEKELANALKYEFIGVPAIVFLTNEKLTWGMSQQSMRTVLIELKTEETKYPVEISLNVQNKFKEELVTQNVVGQITGTEQPDSFIVITGHYDHLGGMGTEVYFPGANDNASGIAMMLNLAEYYTQHPPKYSMIFLAFGGEEVGLIGSFYFTNHPLLDLSKIKFVQNNDIFGTGDEGIKIVNATNNMDLYQRMKKINDEKGYLKLVGKRGPAANSDHHPFDEKGVPAIFIYTMGGIKAYHDIYDRSETLPLTSFEPLFLLITEFIDSF